MRASQWSQAAQERFKVELDYKLYCTEKASSNSSVPLRYDLCSLAGAKIAESDDTRSHQANASRGLRPGLSYYKPAHFPVPPSELFPWKNFKVAT
jgi:hypothetical protein